MKHGVTDVGGAVHDGAKSLLAFGVRMTEATPESIPSIKYFGTTWYERGPRYWRKRFWFLCLALFSVFIVSLVVGVVISALFSWIGSWQCRSVALVAVAIPIAASCYSNYVKLRRSPQGRAMHRPMSFKPRSDANLRASVAAGTAAGIAASVGGGLIAAIGTLFIAGQVLGFLMIALGKYVNEEEWQLARKYGIEK